MASFLDDFDPLSKGPAPAGSAVAATASSSSVGAQKNGAANVGWSSLPTGGIMWMPDANDAAPKKKPAAKKSAKKKKDDSDDDDDDDDDSDEEVENTRKKVAATKVSEEKKPSSAGKKKGKKKDDSDDESEEESDDSDEEDAKKKKAAAAKKKVVKEGQNSSEEGKAGADKKRQAAAAAAAAKKAKKESESEEESESASESDSDDENEKKKKKAVAAAAAAKKKAAGASSAKKKDDDEDGEPGNKSKGGVTAKPTVSSVAVKKEKCSIKGCQQFKPCPIHQRDEKPKAKSADMWTIHFSRTSTSMGLNKNCIVWRVWDRGVEYEIELFHSTFGGKRVIKINGSTYVNEKKALDNGSRYDFRVGDGRTILSVELRPAGLVGFTYELYVNGKPYDEAKRYWLLNEKA